MLCLLTLSIVRCILVQKVGGVMTISDLTSLHDQAGGNEDEGVPILFREQKGEALVGLGFRYWMTGYQHGKFDYWKDGWRLYTDELGVLAARSVVTELATWVQEVVTAAQRPIEVGPCTKLRGDMRFCRDECMAVSLIAACQTGVCPALQACAHALIGDQDAERVICASTCFANRLADHDVYLSGIDAVAS